MELNIKIEVSASVEAWFWQDVQNLTEQDNRLIFNCRVDIVTPLCLAEEADMCLSFFGSHILDLKKRIIIPIQKFENK